MERLQIPTSGRSDFAEKVTPLIQQRAEALLIAVLCELLDRGRRVRASIDSYDWNRPVRSVCALDSSDWGRLTAYVDGIRVCFDWTPVRDQRARNYPQDRLCVRWSRERKHWRTGWKPSDDWVRLLEPKSEDFDPLAVVEAFERWLVERKRETQKAKERAAEIEARDALCSALNAQAQAALPHMLGASEVTVTVASSGLASSGPVGLHVHWNNLTPAGARAVLVALQEAQVAASDRKAAEAFAIPE